jgi:NADPH-dependent 2,4-dienoyl-CoA reductase/sulfur reductase-like enzyme
MAAARRAAAAGRRVVVLDAGQRPGGQYWRHREPPTDRRYRELAAGLSAVDYRPNATVWFAEPGFVLHTNEGRVRAERVVLATGAWDRVVPFPGWDLPGVVTAGGAQALLKGSGVLVGRRVVVAGTGPFLLPVAANLATAGATVVGVFEANNPLRMGARMPAARVAEAARYAAILARHRIPYRWGRKVVAAHGDGRVEAVTVGGRRIGCDTLATGYGFVPAVELPLLLGCATRVDGDQNLVVTVDDRQETSVPGLYAAGEVTGVGGAELATVEGAIAGAAAAGVTTDLVARREKLRGFAAALHEVFPPPRPEPEDGTVVCRCEEVHFGAVREALTELGAADARTLKLLTRMGMGWCQGRMCGYAAACFAATAGDREITHEDLAAFANRPIVQPVSLRDVAARPEVIE